MERNLTHSALKASVVDDSVFSEYFYRTTCRGNPSEISRYYSRVKWWAFFKMEIIRKRNGLDKETCFSLVWEGLWKINSLHLTQFSAKYYVTLKYNSVGLRIIINHSKVQSAPSLVSVFSWQISSCLFLSSNYYCSVKKRFCFYR